MQNKIISVAFLLFVSIAMCVSSVNAQNKAAAAPAATKAAQGPAAAKPAASPAAEKAAPAAKPAPATIKSSDPRTEENKRRLEEELKNTDVSNKGIVNFPNRPSLGSLELTPLPGVNEASINGPLPMGKSVSAKDLPSEQLLGRITPEVFQEMADLERGNTFLKLQLEKEKLKNDLEQLKANYREKRLAEISKREEVVRSRIQWWQEQERLRLEIEKKQAEEEALARKVAEKEMERERVQEEALRRLNEPKPVVVQAQPKKEEKKEEPKPVEKKKVTLPPTMEELYAIQSIRGVGSNLTAKLKNKSNGTEFVVKKDDILPSGHVVREIKKDAVTVAYGNRIDQLVFRPNQ
jgi:type IV pilus biogenesis protein PilP